MPTKEEMIAGLDALEDLIKQQEQLRKDGLIFIFEKGLWQEFLGYHTKKLVERQAK